MRSAAAFAIAAVAATVMAACSAPKPAAERAIYDLGQSVPAEAAPPMRVEVVAPPWLDNGDIAYRLDYEDPARLRQFAGSRWAGRPSQMIGARLAGRFAPGSAKCVLRVELEEFAQHFSAASASTQQLAARWSIVSTGGERLAGSAVRLSEAAGADAPAGVKAAARITDRLAGDIAAAAATLPACRP